MPEETNQAAKEFNSGGSNKAAETGTLAGGEVTVENRTQEILHGYEDAQKHLSAQRLEWRRGQIETMVGSGASPVDIYIEIAGEKTRADNVGCGINGEVDGRVISEYFTNLATQEEDLNKKEAYTFLADAKQKIAESRKVVKQFMVLEQLTDPTIYTEGVDIDPELYTFSLNSALDEDAFPEKDRVFNSFIQKRWLEHIKPLAGQIQEWQKQQYTMQQVGEQILPYIYPKDPERFRYGVESGSKLPEYLAALKYPQSFLNEELRSNIEESNPQLRPFMEGLTYAQGVLEHQSYYVGVGVLRAVENGETLEFPK